MSKGQGAFEYLIYIGAAVFVAVGVIMIVADIDNERKTEVERFSCGGLLLADCGSRYLTDYNVMYSFDPDPLVCVEWQEVDCTDPRFPYEYGRNVDSVMCIESPEDWNNGGMGIDIDYNCLEEVPTSELVGNWKQDTA